MVFITRSDNNLLYFVTLARQLKFNTISVCLLMVTTFFNMSTGFLLPLIFFNVTPHPQAKFWWSDKEHQWVLFLNEILNSLLDVSHLEYQFLKPYHSLLAFVTTTYSTFVVDMTAIFCMCDIQQTSLGLVINISSMVLVWWFTSPT